MLRLANFFVPLATVALLSTSLGQPIAPPVNQLPVLPLTPSKRGVVFSAQMARAFGKQCSRESPVGYWTPISPSKVEIQRLEAALPAWMKARHPAGWDNRFSSYHFQYGAFVRGKTRLIHVNALPMQDDGPEGPNAWRRYIENWCDGGPALWGVEFDPRTGHFAHAAANGIA